MFFFGEKAIIKGKEGLKVLKVFKALDITELVVEQKVFKIAAILSAAAAVYFLVKFIKDTKTYIRLRNVPDDD